MGLFSGSKIKKLEENRLIDELIPYMYDKSSDTAQQARDAFLRLAHRTAKMTPKAKTEVEKMINSPAEAIRLEGWKILLGSGDPALMPQVVTLLTQNNTGPLAEVCYRYFDTVRGHDPDKVRAQLAANEQIIKLILQDLKSGQGCDDPRILRAYRFIELFDLWQMEEVAAKTLVIVQTDKPKEKDKVFFEMLQQAVTRLFPDQMAKMLLVEWEDKFGLSDFNEKMVERFKDVGKKALPLLCDYILHWRNGIETMRNSAAVKDGKYEISRQAIFLIGELADQGDKKIIEWLYDISIDTKLAETGPHRRNAREAVAKVEGRKPASTMS